MTRSQRDQRVVIYLLSLSGGAGKATVQYANILAHLGYSVSLVFGTSDAVLRARLDRSINIRWLGVGRSLRAIPGLFVTLLCVRPHKALIIGVSNVLPFTIARLCSGIECSMILREANSPDELYRAVPLWKRAPKFLAMKAAYRRASYIIALSHRMAAELQEGWVPYREKVVYIPNGVELPRDADWLPRPSSRDVICCVARLTPQKDVPTLLRAFAIVRSKRKCKLLIAGEGREHGALVQLTRELGLSAEVRFLGHVPSPSEIYKASSLTVLSSLYEGFPNTLIESLAHGCPVVSTDCPTGPSEIINSEKVGLLAEVSNADDLAEKILIALDTSYRIEDLLARASEFSIDNANKKISSLFGDV